MFKIFIYDDDKKFLDHVSKKVADILSTEKFSLDCFSNYETLIEEITSNNIPDILLMDIIIKNKKITGIDIIKKISDYSIEIIYMSGMTKYCTDVYETNHTYFITKPISDKDLEKALKKATKNINSKKLIVKDKSSIYNLEPGNIIFIESDRRKIKINLSDKVISVYGTIKDISSQLPNYFVCCHKSFLVNLEKVESLNNNEFILSNNRRIPISQSKRSLIKEQFYDFVGRKYDN